MTLSIAVECLIHHAKEVDRKMLGLEEELRLSPEDPCITLYMLGSTRRFQTLKERGRGFEPAHIGFVSLED